MTEFQHFIVGYSVFMVLWHFLLKKYLINEKDTQRWNEIWREIIRKYF